MLVAGAVIAAAIAVIWLAQRADEGARPVPEPDAALLDEVRRLRRENAELREKLERRPRARAEPVTERTAEPQAPVDGPPAAGAVAKDRIRIAGGGFVVAPQEPDAPVPDLIAKLRERVAAKDDAEMRAIENALVRKGAESVDALVALVRNESEPQELRDAALRALGALQVPGLAALVENLYLSRRDDAALTPERRAAALRAAVGADPDAAVPVVQRLLWSSAPADRATALAGLAGARDRAFLPMLREETMRPGAGPAATGLADTIAQIRDRRWSAFQATGEPDTPVDGDIGAAWASKMPDMGEVWIELDFDAAVLPESLRIRETYNPGAVARVEAVAADGAREVLWEGQADKGPAPRWFEPPLRAARERGRTIRIVLDTNRVPGWNEIDAVELVGEGRRQWASAARASSSYADP